MSLIKQVSQAITRRGTGTAESIAHEFPDHTITQVRVALVNACRTGQLRAIRRGASQGRGLGRLPTTYGPVQSIPVPLNRRMPVNSVWSLAA